MAHKDAAPAALQGSEEQTNAAIIAELFADVFDLDSVELDEDFLELGGDSLMGTSLMVAIEKRFGLVVSISALLESPTPRALAAVLFGSKQRRKSSPLINLRPEGTPPSMLCVHGTDGDSVFPVHLSRALGGKRPLFGFRALGLEEGERPLTGVEEIAKTYRKAAHKAKAKGPYVVLGHCAGSIIAYELAQQLIASGQTVHGLVLIDPEVHEDLAPYLTKSGLALKLFQSSWRDRVAQLENLINSNRNPSGEQRRDLVSAGIKVAAGTYTPKPIDRPVLLFATSKRRDALLDPKRGFPTFVSDLEIVNVDVDHEAIFNEGLPDLAKSINDFVDRHLP